MSNPALEGSRAVEQDAINETIKSMIENGRNRPSEISMALQNKFGLTLEAATQILHNRTKIVRTKAIVGGMICKLRYKESKADQKARWKATQDAFFSQYIDK